MSGFAPAKPTQKTYSHLLPLGRMPSEYELVTSQLHYYVKRGGFEVQLPLQEWYDRYQKGSPLRAKDWDRFHDPRETTYTKYTSLQKDKETFVDGILQSIEDTGYDRELPGAWVRDLGRLFAPLRYPWHGFQMAAAYVGEMAPGGRITIAALFQAADEMRRVQRVAYRMAQLREIDPGFGDDSLAQWERAPLWQPLREAIERLLVTYDWGEAFAALNLCLKPVLDEVFIARLGAYARLRGDSKLDEILFSLGEDCKWHRAWARSLVTMLEDESAGSRAALGGWIDQWGPIAREAAAPFAAELGAGAQPGKVASL